MPIILSLFFSFLKLGFLSFGGGYAMLPLIFENARKFGVVSDEAFAQLVALSQSIPGAVSMNSSTFVGYYAAGFPGAIATTFGLALPSFILVYLVLKFLDSRPDSVLIDTMFVGIRPMTIGLIATAVIYLAENTIIKGELMGLLDYGLSYINPIPLAISGLAVILNGVIKINPVIIILLCAGVGAIFI